MFTNIILISVLLIQLVILYLIYKDWYFRRESPDGYILKKLIEITGGYTSKVTAQYIQRKFKTKDEQTSRILESLKDPEMTKNNKKYAYLL